MRVALTFALCAAATFVTLASSGASPARAQIDTLPPFSPELQSTPETPDLSSIGQLGATQVFTDAYEPNGSQASARFIGSLPTGITCLAPTQFINQLGGQPANFYLYDAADVDFYNITVSASGFYTFLVQQNSPASPEMGIFLRLYLPGNNTPIFNGRDITAPVYIPVTGNSANIILELRAQNPAAVSENIQDYLYGIAGCSSSEVSPTATPTPTQSPTSTPSPTPTTSGAMPDAYEPNNNLSLAYSKPSFIQEGQTIGALNFFTTTCPTCDVDYYFFYGRAGSTYQIATTNVQPGVETTMTVYLAGSPVTDESKLVLLGYNNRINPGQRGSQITFVAPNDNLYWVRVQNLDQSPRVAGQTYSLSLKEVSPNPTATPAAFPDSFELNDTYFEATRYTGSNSSVTLNFIPCCGRPVDFADWIPFFGNAGSLYQITTKDLGIGLDTQITVYFSQTYGAETPGPFIAYNNRYIVGQRGSQVTFSAGQSGVYWINIQNIDPTNLWQTGSSYAMLLTEIAPTVTPTPSSTPTRAPFATCSADRFELNSGPFGNGAFEYSTIIGPDTEYKDLNFTPFNPVNEFAVDNDFFRLPVKQGVYYTCETLNLAAGVDTNIIIYNSDRVGIGGNDDISPADRAAGRFQSRFAWLSSYTGNAYVLVGEVNPHTVRDSCGTNFTVICRIGLPATPTPLPITPGVPVGSGPTAPPPPSTTTPQPTQRPPQNLVVRPIDRTTPVPTPAPTPTPRIFSIDTQVFNDINRNGVLDLGEGISDVSVRLTDEATGAPLGQAQTDLGGRVRFAVQNDGPVRVSVPLFGYTTLVTDQNATIRIGLVSEAELPQRLP